MISLDTLLFPDTDIFRDKHYPLFLFCTPLHFLQLVENVQDDDENETDIFMERGLCQGHTPAPLHNNRDRFRHLIKDISSRKDDYAAQLSSLTIAAMSAPSGQKSGEARYEIITSLLKDHEVADEKNSDAEMKLWQARLVLAIAEILDREQEDLLQQMQVLDEREVEMFRTLQGQDGADEADPFAELAQIKANLEKTRTQEIKNRFKAWLQLMRNDTLPTVDLWLASSRDAADQVINEFEKKDKALTIPVLKLALPERIMVSTSYLIDQIEQFHRAAGDTHRAIVKDLERLVDVEDFDPGNPETMLPDGTDWAERWEMLLDDHFPAHSHGRTALTLYLLPDTPIAGLLGLSLPAAKKIPRHGLLAICDN